MSRKVDWGRYKWQYAEHKGDFTDYDDNEDKVLKQAYEAGKSSVRYDTRGQTYEVSFKSMTQLNVASKKVRRVRHKNVKTKPGKGGGKGGKGKIVVKPDGGDSAPGVAKMDEPKVAKPEKKGCCPCCGACCGKKGLCACCVALPIIGAVVIMIVGGGVPDDLDEFGEMALETADVLGDAAMDAGEWLEDAAGELRHIVD